MSMEWIGPFDSRLNGPFRLGFEVDGGRLFGVRVQAGFAARALEAAIEQRDWAMMLPIAGRVDPEASFFGEWAAAQALERLSKIEVPQRAQVLRVVMAELSRIASHLRCLGLMAREAGSEPAYHYCMRNRERFLDLIESWAGARFNLHFCRVGGVSRDLTDGVLEKAVQECEHLVPRVREINDLVTFSSIFAFRTKHLAYLDYDLAQAYGVTGPVARASDLWVDLRGASGESPGYEDLEFLAVRGRGQGRGDVHDRFVLRVREVLQSAEVIRAALSQLPGGSYWDERGRGKLLVPSGESLARVESPRGILACYCASEGGTTPARVHFRVPSAAGFEVLPRILEGVSVEDLSLALQSLDWTILEVDR